MDAPQGMRVILGHHRNPDIQGGYWQTPGHNGRAIRLDVSSFEQASALCRQYIEANHLGVGNWTGEAGTIVDQAGRRIAYVSYNGRVWAGDPRKDWKNRREIPLEVSRG